MLDQKKNRAFHIHSYMSRHEMPKQLKERWFKFHGKKLELTKKNHSPIGFSSGWYGGKRTHLRPNDLIMLSALYLIPVFRQYFLAAST